MIVPLHAIVTGITTINLPFVAYMMKSFFDDFPNEIEETAMIDGMGALRKLTSVVISLVFKGPIGLNFLLK